MLVNCYLNPWKLNTFQWNSILNTAIWFVGNCRLQNGVHFISVSVCQKITYQCSDNAVFRAGICHICGLEPPLRFEWTLTQRTSLPCNKCICRKLCHSHTIYLPSNGTWKHLYLTPICSIKVSTSNSLWNMLKLILENVYTNAGSTDVVYNNLQ